MVELNEKALEVGEEVVFCPQCGWNSAMDGPALPAPDDGLVRPVAQHVAYFDDGEFHWMSGIAPRNCELYAVHKAATALQSKDEQIERLTRDSEIADRNRDAARANFLTMQQSAATLLARAEAAEQQVQKLTAENERMREIVSKCAAALPNGAHINPKASLDFMAKLPAEIRSVCSALETQEGGK